LPFSSFLSRVYREERTVELTVSRRVSLRFRFDQTEATECLGDGDLLSGLSIFNNKTQDKSTLAVNGLFYAIGAFYFSSFSFLLPPFPLTNLLRSLPPSHVLPSSSLPSPTSHPSFVSLASIPSLSQVTSPPPPSSRPKSPSIPTATSLPSPEPPRPASSECLPLETCKTRGTSRLSPVLEPDAWLRWRRRGCWLRRREITRLSEYRGLFRSIGKGYG